MDLALTCSFVAHMVFRKYLKLPVFGFVDFSCGCFVNKLHKEKCLVKSCGMTWSQAYINKFVKSRGLFVSEPGGFLLSFSVFEQLLCMCVCKHNIQARLCAFAQFLRRIRISKPVVTPGAVFGCLGPGACPVSAVHKRNPQVSLELLRLSVKLKCICFIWKSLSGSAVWKGFIVTVTIKHKYFFISILHYKSRQNTGGTMKYFVLWSCFLSPRDCSLSMVRVGSVI